MVFTKLAKGKVYIMIIYNAPDMSYLGFLYEKRRLGENSYSGMSYAVLSI